MDKKQKENIKRIVGDGLKQVLTKMKISKPSVKMERALKKYSKKLADQFKAEIKRFGKKKNKATKSQVTKLKKKATRKKPSPAKK